MKSISLMAHFIGVLLCVVSIVVGSTPAARAQQKPSGNLTIPARGLFSFNEGTVECWVQFNFDPAEAVEGYTARGQLFLFWIPASDNDLGAQMSVFFASLRSSKAGEKDKSFTFLRAGLAIDGKEVPHPILAECTNWKQGEWHHIAVTWQDARRMAIYFDGKLVLNKGEAAEVEFPYSIARDVPENAQLIFGSQYDQQPNSLVVDEIRLSSVAREGSTLGFGQTPLQPDPFTLLLENFDNVQPANGKSFATIPAVIAAVGLAPAHNLTGGQLVAGKVGRAWQISGP